MQLEQVAVTDLMSEDVYQVYIEAKVTWVFKYVTWSLFALKAAEWDVDLSNFIWPPTFHSKKIMTAETR